MSPQEIRALRKEKGLTQKQLGELCSVTPGAVGHWENGRERPGTKASKILNDLAQGNLVAHSINDLESRMLDKIVEYGGFSDREDFLTYSLKHFLQHGKPLNVGSKPKGFYSPPRPPVGLNDDGSAYGAEDS